MTQVLITSKGRSYLLETIAGEHLDEAYQRLWRIIKHNPSNQRIFEQLVHVSYLWYYKSRYNCTYSDNNERLISMF